MMKFRFFLVGRKGLRVLESIISVFGTSLVSEVICATDRGNSDDCYDEIKAICNKHLILFLDRSDFKPSLCGNIYNFAIGWRWLIQESDNLIVLHDSILPKYRGFAPLVNMLVNGEKKIGVTALLASDEYDKGDILGQVSLDVTYPIKISTAISKVSELYSVLIIEMCNKIIKGLPLEPKLQNEAEATYSLWLNDEDYRVNWAWSAQKIKRFVDAVGYPYGRAETILNHNVVKIDDVELVDDVSIEDRERHVGKVIFFREGSPVIVCGQGLLHLISIELSGSGISQINFRSRFK